MPSLFEQAMVEGDSLMAKIPKVGWRKVHSINDVPADSILNLAKELAPEMYEEELNELIPTVMDQRGSPLTAIVVVDCETESGETETHKLPFTVASKEQLAALQKNFEGIIAMGKASGLKPEEIHAIFTTSFEAYKEASNPQSAQANNMMGNMMSQMMEQMMAGAAGGRGAPPGAQGGADCQPQ